VTNSQNGKTNFYFSIFGKSNAECQKRRKSKEREARRFLTGKKSGRGSNDDIVHAMQGRVQALTRGEEGAPKGCGILGNENKREANTLARRFIPSQ